MFMIAWNEYELKPHYDGVKYTQQTGDVIFLHPEGKLEFYTVETTTYTIKLATRSDMEKFIRGYSDEPPLSPLVIGYEWEKNIQPNERFVCSRMGGKAFNIKVKEVKE